MQKLSIYPQEKAFEIFTLGVEKVYGVVRLLLSGLPHTPSEWEHQGGHDQCVNSMNEALPPHPSEPSTKAAKI